MKLALAHINLRGLPAGTVGWVDPTDATISMYLECGYLSLIPEGGNGDKTQVLADSVSPPDFIRD